MSGHLYLRPLGFLQGPAAEQAVAHGEAAYLAGSKIAFQSVQLLKREGSEQNELVAYRDISQSSEAEIKTSLRRITNSRKALAGLDFSQCHVMGIVNTTPDSFSDGGNYLNPEAAIDHAKKLAGQGAHILDIGGESTRPGAEEVDVEEELKRTLPVVEVLAREGFCLSIDTRKSHVMREALMKGATIINDVSALQFDPESLFIAAEANCPVVLMHAQGSPETMQDNPEYQHVVLDIFDELSRLISRAEKAGVNRKNIIIDPGIGFGKKYEHNVQLMSCLSVFHGLGVPLLVGASRKRFLGEITGEKTADKRVSASVAAAITAAIQGVQIVRVHDVEETAHALKAINLMQNYQI